jgi:hypothetical protein
MQKCKISLPPSRLETERQTHTHTHTYTHTHTHTHTHTVSRGVCFKITQFMDDDKHISQVYCHIFWCQELRCFFKRNTKSRAPTRSLLFTTVSCPCRLSHLVNILRNVLLCCSFQKTYTQDTTGLCPWGKLPDMELTTHIRLVPRLNM